MTSLTIEQITYRVRKIVADHRGGFPEGVGLDTTMLDCGFDSLDHVEMTIAIEEEFRIYITDAEIFGDATTVSNVIALVAKRVGAS